MAFAWASLKFDVGALLLMPLIAAGLPLVMMVVLVEFEVLMPLLPPLTALL